MRKVLLCFGVIPLCLLSCKKEAPKPLTEQEIQQRIDSIAELRIREVERKAARELQHRIKIEVKVKADSILRATGQSDK